MSQFYYIDSAKVSHVEYWWGNKSPMVLLGWIIKWLHIRLPNSTDDPNTESTLPFVVDSLPPEIESSFEPMAAELVGQGFVDPVYHVIADPGTRTTIYWATFRHASGECLARIHNRFWHQAQKFNRGLFPVFLTEFSDSTFLVSSSGKPDLSTPNSVQMNRMHKASLLDLWAAHLKLLQAAVATKAIVPALSHDDIISATERHHVQLRDYNLARGVFRPRTVKEKENAESFSAAVARSTAGGHENAEILAELDRLQNKPASWRAGLWILVGSVIAFFVAGASAWDWKFTLWLIPVLFFHELGHWIAMRTFHYRNLRMFFIPFFGAAVTGKNSNVAGWKKALVYLAGPVPGIAVGVILGIAALVLHLPWMNKVALVLLLLNGLNLLPVLPLDGGHVLHATLFCRKRWLDLGFRIVAILGLVALGALGVGKYLIYIAIAMGVSLPVVFKLAKVTDALRKQNLPPANPAGDGIPPELAQPIIAAVREAFPARAMMSNKILAQHTLSVFETLNARPPGVLATLGLLSVHGGAIVMAVLIAILLVVGQQAGIRDFMAAAARQPTHSLVCGALPKTSGKISAPETAPRNLIVATLKNHLAAEKVFDGLSKTLPADFGLVLFADSIVLSLPVANDAAREQFFDELQAKATNTFVALSNAPVAVSLSFLAPSAKAATNMTQELSEYFLGANNMHLVAPWDPKAAGPAFAPSRTARQAWHKLEEETSKVYSDPSLLPYQKKISAAYKRGSRAEASRLAKEQTEKTQSLQAAARNTLRQQLSADDAVLLDLQAKLSGIPYTNRMEREILYRQVAARLGEVSYNGDHPAIHADAYGVSVGSASHHGPLVHLRWLSFYEVETGLPSLVQWLCQSGCTQIKYEMDGPGFAGRGGDEMDE
jgi:Zn-dependent protease